VKPDIIYTLPEAVLQIAALQQAKADLSGTLTQERVVFSRIIQEQAAALEQANTEKQQYLQWLATEQERTVDKDRQMSSLQAEIEHLRQLVASLQSKEEERIKTGYQLKELQTALFGPRSERYIPEAAAVQRSVQQTLGEEFDRPELEAIIGQAIAPLTTEEATAAILKGSRKHKRHQAHKGRRGIPAHIRTEKIVFDYPGDKAGLIPMGKKVSEYWDFIPGQLIKKIEEHLQYRSADGGKIVCTPVLPRMIERGTVSNALLAHLQTERFVYYVPYYRQLQRLLRAAGVSFAASTIDHWEEVCYRKLKRLLKLLKKIIQQASYIKADETPLKYLHDEGTGKASNGWLWVFLAPEIKLILFEFHPGRGQGVPKEVLKDFKGVLQVDAMASYTAAFKEPGKVTLAACLAHIRRGFQKAQQQNRALVEEVLVWFAIIYKIEAYAKRKKMSSDERLRLRKKYTQPFLNKIYAWLLSQRDQHVPGTPVAKAIVYALNQWSRLEAFMENGQIDVDNNSTERAIRPVTLFRKNSLFASNAHGGERAALFYSLVESCKLNGIDPFEYLQDVYNRLHDCPANELIHLLPSHWKPTPASQHP